MNTELIPLPTCSQNWFQEKSDSIVNLTKDLLKFQQECPSIKKDAFNPHFQSQYADLSGILETVTPVLLKNNLVLIQLVSSTGTDTARIKTVLLHTSGEYISSTLEIKAKKDDAQALGSAITYGRRYGATGILGIAPDDDDDGNEASDDTPPPEPKKNGFDPNDTVLVKKMEQLLTRKEVDKQHWPTIMEKMTGRSAKELDEVIAAVVKK